MSFEVSVRSHVTDAVVRVVEAAKVSGLFVEEQGNPRADPYAESTLILTAADDRYGRTIARPNVLHGRPTRPDAEHEAFVDQSFARHRHLRVGDVITLGSLSNAYLDAHPEVFESDEEPPLRPERFRITGIGADTDAPSAGLCGITMFGW